jgi:hypothetical protein
VRGSLVSGTPPPRCQVVAAAVSVGLAPTRPVHIDYNHLELISSSSDVQPRRWTSKR